MTTDLLITIFVLLLITIPAAIGGVFVFRGTYYRSLPGRVRELEDDSIRKDKALKRQAEELDMWKGIATQTPEIRELIEIFKLHGSKTSDEHRNIIRMLQDLKREIEKINE